MQQYTHAQGCVCGFFLGIRRPCSLKQAALTVTVEEHQTKHIQGIQMEVS